MNSPADNFNFSKIKNSITKGELIRGFNAFNNAIKSTKTKINGNLKVLYKFNISENTEFMSSPHIIIYPQVGFLISKKIFSKAVIRNRIKRQLKESYRNLKGSYISVIRHTYPVTLIFSLSNRGIEYASTYGKLDFRELMNDMKVLLNKIFKEATKNT